MQSDEAVVEKVGDQEYQHPSMRYAGRGTGWEEREEVGQKEKQQSKKKGGERKRHRQHLEAHHRARKATSERTQHIKPTEQQTRTFRCHPSSTDSVTMKRIHHGMTPAERCFTKDAVVETVTRRRSYFG